MLVDSVLMFLGCVAKVPAFTAALYPYVALFLSRESAALLWLVGGMDLLKHIN